MYENLCKQALKQTFGNTTRVSSFDVITDGYRNLTAAVICNSHPFPLFFKTEKPFLYPRTQKFQIEREKAGLLLCAEHDIPAPNLIAAGNDPLPWLLETFVPGKPLSALSLTNQEQVQIAKEFETIFQKLCKIQSANYGDTFEGGFVGKHKDWKQALTSMTQLIYEDSETVGLWDSHAAEIQAALQKALDQIKDTSPAVFYHCDLFSANVMGQADERGLIHIHSLIDFGMSMYAPLHYVRDMTYRYCDLLHTATHTKENFTNEEAYQILRIEPLLLMKLFQYPDTKHAVEQHVDACIRYLNKD